MVLMLKGFLKKMAVKSATTQNNWNICNNRIVVLVDWPNFLNNLPIGTFPPPGFSITGGFKKAIAWLGQFGVVEDVYVFFSSRQRIESYSIVLHKQGFNLIYCPRERKESGDVVDEGLIKFARKIIQRTPLNITHLCLAAGDRDYIPILEEAKKKGLKIIIVAPSLMSLSQKLRRYASTDSISGKKMIYIFSPTSD